MQEFLNGDRTAQIHLLTLLKTPLFGFLYRLCRNPVIAEDLLQETLVTLCTRGETWNQQRPLKPWVYTIARNKFLEWKRRERKIVPFPRPEEMTDRQTFAPPGGKSTKLSATALKPYGGTRLTIKVREGSGCEKCNQSGYRGRLPIYEFFVPAKRFKDCLQTGDREVIRKTLAESGRRTLARAGAEVVAAGQTTVAELQRVTTT